MATKKAPAKRAAKKKPAPPKKTSNFTDPKTGTTAQEEAFCVALVFGRMGHADAYRAAYPTSEKWKPNVVSVKAYELRKRANVLKRLEQMQAERKTLTDASQLCTLEEHLKELADLRDLARGKENFSEARQCEYLRGQVAGHYIERKQVQAEARITNTGPRPQSEVDQLMAEALTPASTH